MWICDDSKNIRNTFWLDSSLSRSIDELCSFQFKFILVVFFLLLRFIIQDVIVIGTENVGLFGALWLQYEIQMWFYAIGWKVFKDHHGVWLDFLSKYFEQLESQVLFIASFRFARQCMNSCVCFFLFIYRLQCRRFVFISGVLCACQLNAFVYRAKAHLNSESTNVKRA